VDTALAGSKHTGRRLRLPYAARTHFECHPVSINGATDQGSRRRRSKAVVCSAACSGLRMPSVLPLRPDCQRLSDCARSASSSAFQVAQPSTGHCALINTTSNWHGDGLSRSTKTGASLTKQPNGRKNEISEAALPMATLHSPDFPAGWMPCALLANPRASRVTDKSKTGWDIQRTISRVLTDLCPD